VSHQVGVGWDILQIIGNDEIHAHKVTADFGFAVTDKNAIGIDKTFFGKELSREVISEYYCSGIKKSKKEESEEEDNDGSESN
jgi:hypothetical protein